MGRIGPIEAEISKYVLSAMRVRGTSVVVSSVFFVSFSTKEMDTAGDFADRPVVSGSTVASVAATNGGLVVVGSPGWW